MFALGRDERKGNLSVSGTLNTTCACELQPSASDAFIERHEDMGGKAGEGMSLRFLARCTLAGLIALLPIAAAFSQSGASGPAISANDLVRAVVANELKPQDGSHRRWMYRVEREEQGKKKTKEVVQTGLGSLDRLVAVDGQPLSAEEQKDETERIGNLVRNPAEQQRLEQTKKKDAEQCKAFFKMLPDALSFTYAGRDGDLIKLSYRPNPSFHPPSREARVFHEMQGELWVHETQRRLVRIRGQLIADVKFAGGLLGHLEKGGHFIVEQRELSPGQWDLTFMEVDMKGKALFFKTIAVREKEYCSDFRTVPDGLTLVEAADMLTKQVIVATTR
jgi:hypothetical protein